MRAAREQWLPDDTKLLLRHDLIPHIPSATTVSFLAHRLFVTPTSVCVAASMVGDALVGCDERDRGVTWGGVGAAKSGPFFF